MVVRRASGADSRSLSWKEHEHPGEVPMRDPGQGIVSRAGVGRRVLATVGCRSGGASRSRGSAAARHRRPPHREGSGRRRHPRPGPSGLRRLRTIPARPPDARSGWRSACCTTANWRRPAAGWRGRAALLEEARPTAWSRAICWCRLAIRCDPRGRRRSARTCDFVQAAAIGERFGDTDLVTLALHGPGPRPDPAGRDRARRIAAGRGDDRGYGRRSLSDGRRRCVLQRDRGLQRDLRSAPRAGVDLGAGTLVFVAAGPGSLSRPLPGAPRRDPATARRLAGGAG